MILPRRRAALQRYGRHKVVAALITFAVVWTWLRWFAPDLRDSLQGFASRTPASAFRERRSGDTVQARGVVETVLPDSARAGDAPMRRARLRTLAGHPVTLLYSGRDRVAAPGDTVRVRGRYEWDPEGGSVSVGDDGWLRLPR